MTSRNARHIKIVSSVGRDTPDQLSARVRRGAIWSVAATLFLRLSNILTTVIVAHVFNRSEFGIFTIALTANTIMTTIGQFGLTSCLTRADFDMDDLAPTLLTFSVVTNMMQAWAMFFFARPIAMALGSGAAEGPVKVLAIAQVVLGFAEIPNCQLIRDFKQSKLFLAQVVGSVPSTVVLLMLAVSGAGPVAYAWSLDLGLFLSACVVFWSVSRYYLPGLKRAALSVLFRVGFPLGAANIINIFLLNVDYALIGHLIGAAALGSYVLAFNVASWPASLLGNLINWISIPAFSRVKNDPEALKIAVANALHAFSIVVLPISTLTLVLSRPLIVALYGTKWMASAEVLSVLVFYGAVSIICTLFSNILAGLGLSRLLLGVQVVWISSLVPAMVIGVHRDGIVGAAVAHVAVIGLVVLPCYLIVLKKTTNVRFWPLLKAVFPAFFASVIAGAAAKGAAEQFASPLEQLVVGLATGSLIYLVAIAPQVITLFGRGLSARLGIKRVLRTYNRTARLIGLPGYNPAKHSCRRSRRS